MEELVGWGLDRAALVLVLLVPADRVAQALGLPQLTGLYLLAALAGAILAARLRPAARR